MRRRQQQQQQEDPIAAHSDALCEYMNGHPAIVLSYARYFGEYTDAESASMEQIDQDGFIVKTIVNGEDQEVRVAFTHSLHAVSQVKDMLMQLAKESELALRGPDPKAQGNMPDSQFSWPDFDVPYMITFTVGLVFVYLDLVPNTTSPILRSILGVWGKDLVHLIVKTVGIIHVFESLITLYFTVVVGRGFFGPVHIAQWCLGALIFGYPFLLHLIPLARRQQKLALSRKESQQQQQQQ
ncbi:hypothetical protein BGZ83_004404 [Gryganskiella cystojenkinii]|nr:hypothetical protein BGZ83_004404 [Gryganskiella cystojenkinii]